MFTPGAQLAAKSKHPTHVVTLRPIGMLHLPSGRLVVGDAYNFQPQPRSVAVGVFAVEASVVTVSAKESRLAGVRIVFSREPVVTWEVAEAGSLTAPTGVFIDAQILPALQTYIEGANSPDEWYYDPPKTEGKTWQVSCFTPDDDRPETCVMFDTNSYNDAGPFTSYWGLDANGTPAMFVSDFNLVA